MAPGRRATHGAASAVERLLARIECVAQPGADRLEMRAGREDLGLAVGDEVVHDPWGRGGVVAATGEGARAQATVDFETVGTKNLLLSATPLRRA